MATGNGTAAVEVDDLTKVFFTGRGRRRRQVDAVVGLTFSVAPGERIAYIGPNGAGKSTSIKMLTGILLPTSGHVRCLGLEPWRERRRLAARIGTLFGQRSQLWFELTARRSLTMLGALHGLPGDAIAHRIGELAEVLEAGDLFDVPVRNLSLGQRMRCELAACMLHAPEILFLDEPTIGLDLLAKQRFRELVVRLNRDVGTTVFLTSHDVADIEQVAERAIVINHGRVITDAPVAALRRSLLATKVIEVGLDAEAPELDLPGVTVEQRSATALTLTVDTTRTSIRAALDAVLDRCQVADISVVDPPLERIIAELYSAPHP